MMEKVFNDFPYKFVIKEFVSLQGESHYRVMLCRNNLTTDLFGLKYAREKIAIHALNRFITCILRMTKYSEFDDPMKLKAAVTFILKQNVELDLKSGLRSRLRFYNVKKVI